jgi:hypothetical protein
MPPLPEHVDDNDRAECEERQEKYLGVSTGNKSSKEEPVSFGNPWPEYLGGRARMCGWFRNVFTSWSYSYMNPILRKGKDQFKDGHHLTIEDLYDVPDDMRSEYLVKQFW